MNAAALAAELRVEGSQLRKKLDTVVVALAADIDSSVRAGSAVTGSPGQPIDTGYLVNSFVTEVGDSPTFSTDGKGVRRDASGTVIGVIPRPVNNAAAAKAGDVITTATNAAYAQKIEEEHKTKPGSVRKTYVNAQALLDRIVERLDK